MAWPKGVSRKDYYAQKIAGNSNQSTIAKKPGRPKGVKNKSTKPINPSVAEYLVTVLASKEELLSLIDLYGNVKVQTYFG